MKTLIAMAAFASLLAVAHPQRAEACGGCFSPPETITSVESHRMVISLSVDRTTLWDQIRYTGNPADFVWVLPVPSAAATIDVADSLFFDELEQYTAPRVQSPPLNFPSCPPPPGAWGGYAADGGASSPDAGVTVYQEQVVGPYETVTIGSEDAGALHAWLTDHGYGVPAATIPTIQHYVDRQNVFVVLRLAPTQGVQAMQPVRVRYPGYMATFPLEMVKVGASGALSLTLWVIADQRFAARNYATVEVRDEDLVWDFSTSSSNYADLFAGAIDAAGGRAWVAEYALPLASLYLSSRAEVDVATQGLPYPFVTRLRTRMLVDAIVDDLELAPSPRLDEIGSFRFATRGVNAPPPPVCPDYDGDGRPDSYGDSASSVDGSLLSCAVALGGRGGAAVVLVAAGLLAAVITARRRRPRPR